MFGVLAVEETADDVGVEEVDRLSLLPIRPCFFIWSITPAKFVVFFLPEPLGCVAWFLTLMSEVCGELSSIKSNSKFLGLKD